MLYIIYDYFLPAYKAGGPIQSIAGLAQLLHDKMELGIVCSNKDLDDTLLPVTTDAWTRYGSLNVYYNSNGIAGIKKAVHPGSTIFINGLFTPAYTVLPALILKGRRIISVRGMLHPGGLAEKRLKKTLYLQLCRLLGLQRKCEFHASTSLEKEYIQQVFGKKVKVWVIPNLPRMVNYVPAENKKPGELRICTIALISPMKNHLEVLKALSACRFAIQYDIYGPVKDERYWKACTEVIKTMPSHIRVIYHGIVPPETINTLLSNTQVYIQPSKAENFGHSLYEALAKGRPVITSDFTPWSKLSDSFAGINVCPDKTAEILQAIEHFAQMNAADFEKWSSGARAYATSSLDINKIEQDYLDMFSGTINEKQTADDHPGH